MINEGYTNVQLKEYLFCVICKKRKPYIHLYSKNANKEKPIH